MPSRRWPPGPVPVGPRCCRPALCRWPGAAVAGLAILCCPSCAFGFGFRAGSASPSPTIASRRARASKWGARRGPRAVGADLDGLLLGLARLLAAALLRRAPQRQRRRLRRREVRARQGRLLKPFVAGRLDGHHLGRLLGAVVAPRRAAVRRRLPVVLGPGIAVPQRAPVRAAPLPGAPPLLLLLLLAPPRGRGVIDGPVVVKLEIVQPAHALLFLSLRANETERVPRLVVVVVHVPRPRASPRCGSRGPRALCARVVAGRRAR